MILAHRGDSFHAPENTIEAARLGLEAGADGWELDVRLTLDGIPVVIHDESLIRTTDVVLRLGDDPRGLSAFPVGQFSLDEVKSLDAGSWFVAESNEPRSARGFGTLDKLNEDERVGFRSGSVRVPTLVEALSWTMDEGWLVNVEIKPTSEDAGRLVDAVLQAITDVKAWDCVTISSFDHQVVEQIARRESRVATGALILGPLDQATLAWAKALGIDAIHGPPWSADARSVDPLLVYTVNEAEPGGLAMRLAGSGVAGLFTDDPRSMVELFGVNRS
jgi:glycerophosphoryl diester phosphodiesterase